MPLAKEALTSTQPQTDNGAVVGKDPLVKGNSERTKRALSPHARPSTAMVGQQATPASKVVVHNSWMAPEVASQGRLTRKCEKLKENAVITLVRDVLKKSDDADTRQLDVESLTALTNSSPSEMTTTGKAVSVMVPEKENTSSFIQSVHEHDGAEDDTAGIPNQCNNAVMDLHSKSSEQEQLLSLSTEVQGTSVEVKGVDEDATEVQQAEEEPTVRQDEPYWIKPKKDAQELQALLPSVQSRKYLHGGVSNLMCQQLRAYHTLGRAASLANGLDFDDEQIEIPESQFQFHAPRTSRELQLDLEALESILPTIQRRQNRLLLVALKVMLQEEQERNEEQEAAASENGH